MKMTIKIRSYGIKMDSDEVQEYMKLKRGNGSHKNKKAYSRKEKYKNNY